MIRDKLKHTPTRRPIFLIRAPKMLLSKVGPPLLMVVPHHVLPRFGPLLLIAVIAWFGWDKLGPRRPEIDAARQRAADQVIPKIVEDLRQCRGSIRLGAMTHFTNDATDYFTDQLRMAIERRGVLDLRDRTLGEKLRGLLNLRFHSYASHREAANHGRRLHVQGVVWGTIHAFESYPRGAKLDVEVNLIDTASGTTVFSRRYYEDGLLGSFVQAVVGQGTGRTWWLHRAGAWAIVVLLLPVFSIGFIRAMVRKESNATNAFVLAVYTGADLLLACLIAEAPLTSAVGVVLLIIAAATALLYNAKIMTMALRPES
ncbi:MAG: hypothetical protein KBE65_20660 [Phycisphaerae bacterium]|nr:hypothetical protein [Phycisphaerae bacterium]